MATARQFFDLPPSIRIAAYYLAFSIVWILLSDNILNEYQTVKGLGFVTISAISLGYFIHRAWRAREQSERRFRAVVENASDIITIIDRSGMPLYQSPSIQRVLGYAPDDLVNRNVIRIIHREDRRQTLRFLRPIIATPGATGSTEFRVIAANGQTRYLSSIVTNLLDDPSVVGVVMNSRDITDRKHSEQELARQLAWLEALHAIDLAILGNPELADTLDVVLTHVTDELATDAASILLVDRTGQQLAYARGTGFRSDVIEGTSVPIRAGTPGEVLLTREPRIIEDLDQASDFFLRDNGLPDEGFIGYAALPLIAKDELQGVMELFFRRPLEPSPDWTIFANSLAAQTAIAIDSAQLVEQLRQANEELETVYNRTLEGWAAALELCDDETEGHCRRVVNLTLQLAEALEIDESETVHIRRGALLHDIGKIGVPDTILLKPEPLTDDDWEIMRQHPVYAYDLLKSIPYLHPALDIPHYHHERWDGSGYPRGLAGREIPLHARIFAVVDVYDALTSDRPYRKAWNRERALEYIRDEAGRLFDPDICAVFLNMMASNAGESEPLHGTHTPEGRKNVGEQ